MRFANRIVEGLTFVAVGLIFLGNTLGYLPWTLTATIVSLVSLWPVLLVTAGLDIVGKGLGTPVLRLLSSVVLLGAVLYGGLILPATDTSISLFRIPGVVSGDAHPFGFTKARGSTESATIDIKGGAGEISVNQAPSAVLASVSGETPFDNPGLTVSRKKSHATVTAFMGSGNIVWPVSGRSMMDVLISPSVVWDVRLQTGACTLDANLEDVPVSAFTLKTGASDSRVKLGRVPSGVNEVNVRIESGASSVILRIPDGVEARVEAQVGIAAVSVPSDMSRVGGDGRNYETSGYSKSTRRYRIRVQTGVGSVSIQRY